MSSGVPLIDEFSNGVITKCNSNANGEYILESSYNGFTITEFGKLSCTEITGITKIDLSRTQIQSIKDGAFLRCSGLASIILPDSLTFIGYNSLAHTNLSTLQLPDNILYFDSGSVNQILFLESIEISNSQKYLSEQGFLFDITKTTLIFCPRHVASVDEIPFFESITTISDCALTSTKIVSFVGGSALTSLNGKIFHAMGYLITINLTYTNITTIQSNCFRGCSFIHLYLPMCLQTIQTNAFYFCSRLKILVLYSNVISLQSNMISECVNLKKIIYFGVMDFSNAAIFQEESMKYKVKVFVTEFYPYSQFAYINVNINWYRRVFSTCGSKPMNQTLLHFILISLLLM